MEVLNPDSFCPVEEQKTEKKFQEAQVTLLDRDKDKRGKPTFRYLG